MLSSIPVPLDSMFELFRGMNVGLTMTGQAITQLPRPSSSAALTNAATLVVFRQNARADAELLARQLPGVSAEQLQHLDKFAAVMRLGLGDGEVAPTVTGTTEPLPAPITDPIGTASKLGRALRPQRRGGRRRAGGASWPQPADERQRCRARATSGTGRRRRTS